DKLVISVKGANIPKSNTALKQGLAPKGKASSAVAPTVYEFADVDMAVSVGNNLPVKTVNAAMGKGRSGLAADASTQAVEAIEAGVKYVVYIYEGNTFVSSALLESGTEGTIEGLDPQGSYTWVALSHNDATDAPAETPTAVDVDLPENKDVLYASGTIDLATSNTIDITFNHVYSRIGIELNTIGVFGEITGTPAVSVSGLNIAGGSLNLLDGTLTASTSTSAATLSYADFVNVDEAYDDAMIAYVYTAPVAQQNFQLKVQNLAISHVDNVGGTVSRTFFATETPFNLSVTPAAGQSHHLLLNVVESALVTNHGGREVKWGRSNLYYRGDNGGLRNYAFYANNELSSRADGYFGFGATVPFQFATTSTQGDPCTLVYPQNLWKSPSKADFSGLVSGDVEFDELTEALGPLGEVVDATGITSVLNLVTNLLGGVLGSAGFNTEAPNSTLGPDPYDYAQYVISQGGGSSAFDDASNNLRFYYNGQITDITALQAIGNGEGLLGIDLNNLGVDLIGNPLLQTNLSLADTYGIASALWTDEQGADLLGVIEAGTWGYLGTTSRDFRLLPLPGFGPRYVLARNTGEVLNGVSALGVDVLSTSMKN